MADKKATFSAEERAAMKEYAAEKRAQAKVAKTEAEHKANLKMCTDSIAKLGPADRKLATAVHKLVLKAAPELKPKTWYGMPAYANADGNPVLFFQAGEKFKTRYSTLGFTHHAKLDKGDAWPTSYAIAEMSEATEKLVLQLVARAVR